MSFRPRPLPVYNPTAIMPNSAQSEQLPRSLLVNESRITNWEYQPQPQFFSNRRVEPRTAGRPQFRAKIVCILDCKHCQLEVCRRGMKAILLADMNIELFSTDSPPYGIELVNDDYRTRNCGCRIRDVACLGCGNVIGYHVTQPCEPCMDSCNNGHFWMFHCQETVSKDRMGEGGNAMAWSQIPRAEMDNLATGRKFPLER